MTEPVIHRPHCEQPTACQARGAGHCRRCHGRAAAKALHEDPEFKAAASARMKALNAERLAKLGLEPHEAEEWRAIRAKGYTGKEAARIVIRSRREVAA